jgi:hypothetical protein
MMCKFSLIEVELVLEQVLICPDLRFSFDVYAFSQFAASIRFVQNCPQALAIQGLGMIGSNWPDWVILLYIIGAEFTVE